MQPRVVHSWLYTELPEERGSYAQVRGRPSTASFQDVYRRCLATFFASAKAADPTAHLVLWLNRPWDPTASETSQSVLSLMQGLEVDIRLADFDFAPPVGAPLAWRNQFFVLDILREIDHEWQDQTLHLLLDSDVIWTGDASTAQMWQDLSQFGHLAYELDYALDLPVNGFSRKELTSLASALGFPASQPLSYFGGEFVALRGDVLRQAVDVATSLWPVLLSLHAKGERIVTEEAHFLSLVYHVMDLQAHDARPVVKRLWTQVGKYQNATRDDLDLPLWHLPAEKRYGIRRLYDDLQRAGGTAWSVPVGETWRTYAAKQLGLPRNTRRKAVQDLLTAAATRISELRGRESSA